MSSECTCCDDLVSEWNLKYESLSVLTWKWYRYKGLGTRLMMVVTFFSLTLLYTCSIHQSVWAPTHSGWVSLFPSVLLPPRKTGHNVLLLYYRKNKSTLEQAARVRVCTSVKFETFWKLLLVQKLVTHMHMFRRQKLLFLQHMTECSIFSNNSARTMGFYWSYTLLLKP